MGDLYADDLLTLASASDKPDFDDTAFFDAAGMVYRAGGFDPSQLSSPEARRLIAETLSHLRRAIDSGVPHEVPEVVRHALENNAFIFSGFKAYHSLREVGLSLTTDKGEIKPFEQFHADVQKVNNQYNHNYLYAEYNHAVSSSLSAAKWQRIEADGDRYDLQYRTAGDDLVREDHRALDKITLPPSDPFWSMYTPPNGWNCRCNYVQVRKGKYQRTDPELAMLRGNNCTEAAKQQIFRFNPGKSLQLFPPKHPYYKAPEAAKQVIEDMAAQQEAEYLRRRVKEIREYMAEHLADPLVNEGLEKPANMSSRSVKEFTNQPHKHKREKNELLLDIQRVFKAARYLGINPAYELPGLVASHILEIQLCGEPSWLVVREYDDGSFKLYSCSDNPKIATGLIQKKKP
ncbi:MAG: phage minor head protein [Prevotella sp.]|nr:phage minor head protein [Bacteroides sp.]MCM1446449.1 phage minor head protein [Prevotella sp.]